MKVNFSIEDFLTKYPNIHNFSSEKGSSNMMNPYEDDNFNMNIYKKKEFYQNRLDQHEETINESGELYKHQKIVSLFLSSNTLYDELLLFHEMGTGKTCSSIAAIEKIRSEKSSIDGAIIFAKGEGLLNNYMNEILFKCTKGQYIPEDFDNLTENEKTHRIRKELGKFYDFHTFETFAKIVRNTSNDELTNKYSNKIIVIDEIHNLRKGDEDRSYEQFHKFLHLLKNRKIILMSGTPMKDSVDEIASVMNLILPMQEQLPTGMDFIDEYFIKNVKINEFRENNIIVNPEKVNELKNIFKGRISYLKSMVSDIKKQFIGEHIGSLEKFKVFPTEMSKLQYDAYIKAYQLDTEDVKGIYSKSRQATLFVFPDGSYGSAGFNKYIREINVGQKYSKLKFLKKDNTEQKRYRFTEEFISQFKNLSDDEKLEIIRTYSCKYAEIIKSILDAKNKKSVFIYCEFVQGSGIIVFTLLLELFGYTSATGNEMEKGLRFASITNITSTQKKIRNIIRRFNNNDNVFGEFIQVIIGSRVISEGFSLSNVQIEHIITPHWNYSETSQAISRGIRVGSHNGLLEKGIIPTVDIYQHVSLNSNYNTQNSIDLLMYEISEKKDINIKHVERIIKESAFDCGLNYSRNANSVFMDYSRDCDYMKCDYKCDDIPTDVLNTTIENDHLDFSSFDNSDIIQKITIMVKKIFMTTFIMTFSEIVKAFNDFYRPIDIISALTNIINKNIEITNKYGFTSYLREENDVYFLVKNLYDKGLYNTYYCIYPTISTGNTFQNIINNITAPSTLKKICTEKIENNLKKTKLFSMPLMVQNYILENAVIANLKNKDTNFSRLVIDLYKNYIVQKPNIIYNRFLEKSNIIRCINLDVDIDQISIDDWKLCEEEKNILTEETMNEQYKYENNPYKVYGQLNTTNDKFCIRDMRHGVSEKKHKRTGGKVCNVWNKYALLEIIVDNLKIEIPRDFMNDKSKNELLNLALLDKNIVKAFDNRIQKLSIEDLRRALFFSNKKIIEICNLIEKWFTQNDLLMKTLDCGIQGKKKI